MKKPNARKLPSGSWYCRVRVEGRDVSITRPTEKEAVAEAMAIKAGLRSSVDTETTRRRGLTVSQAIDQYIAARSNILSPSTIRGYRIIQRNRFQQAMQLRICDISQENWQRIVNAEAKRYSAKTMKNTWGFISSVVAEVTGKAIVVRLPQVVERDLPFLSSEDIRVFVNAIHGKPVEIPALLALSSLRRSEIMGLRWESIDLNAGLLYVKGAAVLDEHNDVVFRAENKNNRSRRVIPIIPPLMEALRQQKKPSGLVVPDGSPSQIYMEINRICRQNGLPQVGVHGLRRSFASLAYHLGFSEEMTMRIGGWANIITMRRIYTKLSAQDINAQSAVLTDFFRENGNKNGDTGDIET